MAMIKTNHMHVPWTDQSKEERQKSLLCINWLNVSMHSDFQRAHNILKHKQFTCLNKKMFITGAYMLAALKYILFCFRCIDGETIYLIVFYRFCSNCYSIMAELNKNILHFIPPITPSPHLPRLTIPYPPRKERKHFTVPLKVMVNLDTWYDLYRNLLVISTIVTLAHRLTPSYSEN